MGNCANSKQTQQANVPSKVVYQTGGHDGANQSQESVWDQKIAIDSNENTLLVPLNSGYRENYSVGVKGAMTRSEGIPKT